MSDELQRLIEMAKRTPMTPQQKEEQRVSFAYGNAKLTNDYITRQDVEEASQRLKESRDEQPPAARQPAVATRSVRDAG